MFAESLNLDFWNERRVLITGASGLVGSWLVKKLLESNAYIVALMRDSDPQSELHRSGNIRAISVVNGMLQDIHTLERAINEHQIDTVFHLAAQAIVGVAHRSPYSTFESNVRGTYNLLEVCRLHKDMVKQIIIASSDKAYGEQESLPYIENMPLQGKYPYEVSKSCTDLIAQSYYHTYNLPLVIARCGNIFGGGDLNWSRIVPSVIRSCYSHKPPLIRSDGKYVRDYFYVKDVAWAYIILAEQLGRNEINGEAFNFSNESPLTVLELTLKIQDLMGCENILPIIQNSAKGEIRDQYLSAAKARKYLGWSPLYNLEQGLIETIEWYTMFLGNRH